MKNKINFLNFSFFLSIIFMLMQALSVQSQTTYYVKATGNDSNTGLSDEQAWKTFLRVSSKTFNAGDKILFNRGDTFRGSLTLLGSGSSGIPIIVDAYGTGDKPKILGAKDLSSTGDWTTHSGNIWKTTATTPAADCANLIFNNEGSCGVKKQSIETCTAQGDFFYNISEHKIYLYSSSNPGSYYSHIEAGGVHSENIITLNTRSYWTVRNLDVRYSGNNGIFIYSCTNVIVEYCDFSWIGGWYYMGGPIRMGNAVQMWKDNSYLTIRYNRINKIYDAGISPQGSDTYTQSNINMYYNVITNCWYSFEFWINTGATGSNINFYNNTCVNAGSTWSASQRPDQGNGRHVIIWTLRGTVTGLNIKNNIFKTCTEEAIRIDDRISSLTSDYNLFNVTNISLYEESITYTTLAQWRTASGEDANSISDDPDFFSESDYHLQESSPAINAGVLVGLTTDFEGNSIVGSPDIGAYEYSLTQSGGMINKPKESFLIYPNPVKDKLTIAFNDNSKQVSLKLYDSRGIKLYEEIVTGNSIINMSSYSSGLYILNVGSEEGKLKVVKIIK